MSGGAGGGKQKKKKPTKQKKPLFGPGMRSMKRARSVTSEFHRLTRILDGTQANGREKEEAKRQLEEIGGRAAYQEASVLTTKRHRTAKWTFSMLTKRDFRPKSGERRLRTLEVGAINTDLMSAKFLDVRAIDIRSQHPKIEQIDFFDLPVEPGAYDVVHSSMVLNCVPTAELRGEMLARTATFLRTGGLFFLMIPVRCVKASSRMTHEKMTRYLRACGMRVVEHKSTPKVMFYCAEKLEKPPQGSTLNPKAIAARDAREDFVRQQAKLDARADAEHFGVILKPEHLCGF